jgi:hypothetical protein
MSAIDDKVRLFRNRNERTIRRIITQAVGVSQCTSEGNVALEETEMNELAKLILVLVDQEKKSRQKDKPAVTPLKAVSA